MLAKQCLGLSNSSAEEVGSARAFEDGVDFGSRLSLEYLEHFASGLEQVMAEKRATEPLEHIPVDLRAELTPDRL